MLFALQSTNRIFEAAGRSYQPHPNVAKMAAAVERWITEAQARPNTAELLWSRVEWLEQQSAILSGPGDTPEHLEGLGAFDLAAGIARLTGAATTAERESPQLGEAA